MTIEIGPHSDKPMLAIFAKQPIAGQSKTRLAQTTYPDWAQRAAQAMLEDSLDRLATIDAARAIYFAPANAEAFFDQLSQGRFQLASQPDGDLGWRLRCFFDLVQRDYGRTVVVGADSPTLPTHYITDAFRALQKHDIVIGPACDGGFYLIGMRQKLLRPFVGVNWGSSHVLEELMERLPGDAKPALLAPWYDIDTADDWAMLRGHIKAMRQAGIDPGVPRVERLIEETRIRFSGDRQTGKLGASP